MARGPTPQTRRARAYQHSSACAAAGRARATRPPSSVGPVRSSVVAPSRLACSRDVNTSRGTLPSTAAASKAASSNLSPAAALACCLSTSSTSSGSDVEAPASILVDRIGWIVGRPCALRIQSSGTEVEAPTPMLPKVGNNESALTGKIVTGNHSYMKYVVPGTNPNHVPVKRHRGERDTQGTHRSHGQTSQASLTTNPTHKRAHAQPRDVRRARSRPSQRSSAAHRNHVPVVDEPQSRCLLVTLSIYTTRRHPFFTDQSNILHVPCNTWGGPTCYHCMLPNPNKYS